MPPSPIQTLTLSSREQVQALLDVRHGTHLLRQFTDSATASQVAARLGEAPSRVAYHARKLERLGFLKVTHTRGRERWLECTATRFLVPPDFLSPDTGQVRAFLRELLDSYLRAQGKATPAVPEVPLTLDLLRTTAPAPSSAPAVHFRVVRVTPDAYARAMQAAWDVIAQVTPTGGTGERLHTIALLGFPGSPLPLREQAGET